MNVLLMNFGKNEFVVNIFDDIDVFESEEENTNTSRLSASTIEQLFEDTNYNIDIVDMYTALHCAMEDFEMYA